NRLKTMFYPQDVENRRRRLVPHYNRAGALEQVELDGAPYVGRIAHNAKGQRTLIAFGNGVLTRYAYDPHTFRLARLRSERSTVAAGGASTYRMANPSAPLQDLSYSYDLVGNILGIVDRTPGGGVAPTPDTLGRRFGYDPIYRLTSATGRECDNIAQRR